MPLAQFLAKKKPDVRAGLGSLMPVIVAVRREVLDYHDALLAEQASETPETAGAMEQTQQTLGALVRELNNLMEMVRKNQTIGDQLDRVHADLRGKAA